MGTFRMPNTRTETFGPPLTQRVGISRRLRVLVVDDYPDAAETLALLLRMDGHEVLIAGNGSEAMNATDQFHPDAIILDISLPDRDGYEVAAALRAMQPSPAARLIAMADYPSREFRERTQAAGFDGYLVKPVTSARLQDTLVDRPDPRDAPL